MIALAWLILAAITTSAAWVAVAQYRADIRARDARTVAAFTLTAEQQADYDAHVLAALEVTEEPIYARLWAERLHADVEAWGHER